MLWTVVMLLYLFFFVWLLLYIRPRFYVVQLPTSGDGAWFRITPDRFCVNRPATLERRLLGDCGDGWSWFCINPNRRLREPKPTNTEHWPTGVRSLLRWCSIYQRGWSLPSCQSEPFMRTYRPATFELLRVRCHGCGNIGDIRLPD